MRAHRGRRSYSPFALGIHKDISGISKGNVSYMKPVPGKCKRSNSLVATDMRNFSNPNTNCVIAPILPLRDLLSQSAGYASTHVAAPTVPGSVCTDIQVHLLVAGSDTGSVHMSIELLLDKV